MSDSDWEHMFPPQPCDRWLFLAVVIAILAVGSVLVPTSDLWNNFSTERSLIPMSERMTLEEARQEVALIRSEIKSRASYEDGDIAYRHMNQLFYIERHLPLKGAELIQFEINQLKQASAILRESGGREKSTTLLERFGFLRDNDPNSSLKAASTIIVERHWEPVLRHMQCRIPISIGFMLFFFISMLMYHDKLIEELRDYLIFRLVAASVLWPVAMWVFPSRFLAYKAARTLVWLRFALSAGVSLAPLALKAQMKKVGADENRSEANTTLTNNNSWRVGVDMFGDSRHDRQFNLRVTRGWLTLFSQNRITADGKSAISLVNIGPHMSMGKRIEFFLSAGPQYTGEKGRVDRTVVFLNGSLSSGGKAGIKFMNRLSFGHEGEKTPFADRHVQEMRGPPLPAWLSIEGEELHSSGKWRELFFGPRINLGGLFRRGGILRSVSLYPYWDAAKGDFDLRIWLSFSFSQ